MGICSVNYSPEYMLEAVVCMLLPVAVAVVAERCHIVVLFVEVGHRIAGHLAEFLHIAVGHLEKGIDLAVPVPRRSVSMYYICIAYITT